MVILFNLPSLYRQFWAGIIIILCVLIPVWGVKLSYIVFNSFQSHLIFVISNGFMRFALTFTTHSNETKAQSFKANYTYEHQFNYISYITVKCKLNLTHFLRSPSLAALNNIKKNQIEKNKNKNKLLYCFLLLCNSPLRIKKLSFWIFYYLWK